MSQCAVILRWKLMSATPPSKITQYSAPYYELRKEWITCPKCGWQGRGSELEVSEIFGASCIIEYVCPTCSEDVAFTPGPTAAETRAHWDEANPADRLLVELIEGGLHERE